MNQILIIIAIVGIGYLLYRSLVIKRQPTDDEAVKNQEAAGEGAKTPGLATTAQRQEADAKPLTAHNPNSPEPAQTHQDAAVAQPSPTETDTASNTVAPVPAGADQVGQEAVAEAHKAEAKAAQREHLQTASDATKSTLEQQLGSGKSSDGRPPVPESVELQASALRETDDPLARHRLYQQIIEQCYRAREEESARHALHYYAQAHIAEFERITAPLKKQNGGKLPQVATFKHYSAILTESGQYDEAIAVCQQALAYKLKDGTKTGYQGRIERIEKLRAKQQS